MEKVALTINTARDHNDLVVESIANDVALRYSLLADDKLLSKNNMTASDKDDFVRKFITAAYDCYTRWGAKGTAAVLARYLHLESIPADHADWDVTVRGGKRLSEELEAARDDALLYRTLATLRRDVPLPEDLDALEWKGADRNLHRFCEQIGERTLPGRVPRWHA